MANMLKTDSLIRALHNLYEKVSKFVLIERIGFYRSNTGSVNIPDISSLLDSHIEKLAVTTKQGIAPSANRINESFLIKTNSSNDLSVQDKDIDGLANHYKVSASKYESSQYMGEKFKASIWLHIHTAFMQARSGQLTTAKVHADIASQALKEAIHYMSDEDFRAFYTEVEKVINELQELK
ncbi:MAG: hypothetical protein OQK76_02215 [Gammaproteobacteria bacterium]|nr:hypothetical protein [Gammaproteobacteria bacterium]